MLHERSATFAGCPIILSQHKELSSTQSVALRFPLLSPAHEPLPVLASFDCHDANDRSLCVIVVGPSSPIAVRPEDGSVNTLNHPPHGRASGRVCCEFFIVPLRPVLVLLHPHGVFEECLGTLNRLQEKSWQLSWQLP